MLFMMGNGLKSAKYHRTSQNLTTTLQSHPQQAAHQRTVLAIAHARRFCGLHFIVKRKRGSPRRLCLYPCLLCLHLVSFLPLYALALRAIVSALCCLDYLPAHRAQLFSFFPAGRAILFVSVPVKFLAAHVTRPLHATAPIRANFSTKYTCPLPVTFVVLLIDVCPSACVIVVSLMVNSPNSIARCVGML